MSNCAMCDINKRAKETNKTNWDNEAAKFKEYKVDSHAVIMGIRGVGFYSTEYELHLPDSIALNIWIACRIPQQVLHLCGIGCGNITFVIG